MSLYRQAARGLVFFAAIVSVCAGCNRLPGMTPSDRPNVILISVDTLRADMLGCYGHEGSASTSIDSLASQGVVFEQAFAPAPWTPPSHASMLTGMYPSHHGLKPDNSSMRHDKIRLDVPMLAEIFQDAGYATAGYVRGTVLRPRSGFFRGFDHFVSIDHSHRDPRPSPVIPSAIGWLKMKRQKPVFMFLHVYDVHSDYTSLPKYERMHVGPYRGVADGTTSQLQRVRRGDITLAPHDIDHLKNLYRAGIRQFDDQLATLLEALDGPRFSKNTLIVFTSDHGEEFLEHGSVLHGRSHYQEISHVPLIFKGMGLPAGMRISEPVSLVDIFPTLLSLLKLQAPAEVDGIDLSGHWQADRAIDGAPRYLFAESDWGNPGGWDIKRAVRWGNLKLHYDTSTQEVELYDLDADPGERTNLADAEKETVERMLNALEDFMKTKKMGPVNPPLSPEEELELKNLGYLE